MIAELKKKLESGEITSVELTKHYLEKIDNSKLNAFITVCGEKALQQAEESDKRYKNKTNRSLEGIPFGIKDLFCTKDIRTTAGSKILSNFVPFYESTVTQRLWDAGAVCLGKCNMDEFAMGSTNTTSYFGATINPYGDNLVPGGSSGGPAAAMAGDLAVATLGSDTGGSIRQPAAFCGIVGLLPTYGLCSRFGMVAFASSLDQAGPMTKTVTDAAIVLENIAGYDPRDANSLNIEVPHYSAHINPDVKGKKIAVFHEFLDGLNAAGKASLESGIKWFEDGGATVEYVHFPILKYALPTYYIIAPAEASSNLARYDGVRYGVRAVGSDLKDLYINTRSEGFGEEVKRRILIGTYVLSAGHYDAYYTRAQKVRQKIRNEFEKLFQHYDLVLGPTTPTTAFSIDNMPKDPKTIYLNDVYTVAVNLAGLPGISVPAGLSEDGLPVGLQLIGPRLSEQMLFNAGRFIELQSNFRSTPAIS